MEAYGANFLDDDWESLSKMFSIEETDSSHNFLNHQNLSYDHSLTFYHQDNNTSEPSMHFHIDDSNLNTSVFSDDHHHLMENVLSLKHEIWCSNEQLRLRENDDSINVLELKKRNYVETSLQSQDDIDSSEGPQKKSQSRRNYKGKRATQPRKNKNVMVDRDSNEEETINNTKGKQSSSCSSINIFDQEDSIPNDNSQEISKSSVSLNSNGKAKATRGSATDSQSLYARRRRERINERLKILQNLVPNGTKVDISTMLEEAVHYVKFLQLQIKLLSSDELWMYAPIAYNGLVDIGIMYQKICLNQRP